MKMPFVFAFGLAATTSAASLPPEPPHVRAELVSEAPAVRPGRPFTVALRLRHDPGWHTYWRNPGDAGLPTRLNWDLPAGFSAGPLLWPTPEPVGDSTIPEYGYTGEALLSIEMTPPSNLSDREVLLQARVDWLECKDICIPGKAVVSLRLPVSATASSDPKVAELFSLARERLPRMGGSLGVRAGLGGGKLWLEIPAAAGPGPCEFFPQDNDPFGGLKGRREDRRGERVLLSYDAPDRAAPNKLLRGDLVVGPGRSISIEVPLSPAPPPGGGFLWTALLLAFAGGMILNLMPCVLPVLSLKILGFLREAGGDPKTARRRGFLYSAGVLFSFWVMAGLLLALRAGGRSVGWGFQLQSPVFVAVLAAVFVLLALNLFGLFEIGVSLTRLGGVEGGAFAGGVLAVAAATPCTAPFMGTALGFAVTRPPLEALAVFTALGMGMAWPYAALTASPRFLKLLPKPGPWMLTLKKVFGAALLATAFWLVWVFARLTLPSPFEQGMWEPFTPSRVEQLRGEGRPVFVDFTADWCLSCQVNERFALRDARVVRRFLERNVAALRADWTRRDPGVTRALESFGRTGVPLYVYYPPGASNRPIVLPALLTPGIVLDAINNKEEN